MTTIVFHKGQLITDSCHVINSVPSYRKYHSKIMAGRSIAVASTGITPTPKVFDEMILLFLRLIADFNEKPFKRGLLSVDDLNPSSLQKDLFNTYFAGGGIVVSRHIQVVINDIDFGDHQKAQFIPLQGSTFGAGTGGEYMATLLQTSDMSVEEAYKATCAYDPHTGGRLHVFPTSSLREIVMG